MGDERIEPLPMMFRHWRSIVVLAFVGAGLGLLYGSVATKWYAATITVVPSQHQDSAAMAIAARLPISLDNFQTDVQRIKAVLTSNSVADEVIAKYDLQRHYGERYLEKTRYDLWKHCGTSVDRKSGVVALTCEDESPELARDMASYFGEVGNKVFGRVSVSSAREERKFLESQVAKAREDVDDVSKKLREFQEEHRVIDLPEQAKAVISAMAQIKGDMISKQIELSYLTGFSSRGESSVLQLQQQIDILEGKLAQLEASQAQSSGRAGLSVPAKGSNSGSGSGSGDGSASFFPEAMSVPKLRFELEQLMREQKVRETVFSLLTQRYEMAKVDEARDTSTFQILDYPTLPTYHSRPRRGHTTMLGFALGIVAAMVWIFGPAIWRRRPKLNAASGGA